MNLNSGGGLDSFFCIFQVKEIFELKGLDKRSEKRSIDDANIPPLRGYSCMTSSGIREFRAYRYKNDGRTSLRLT